MIYFSYGSNMDKVQMDDRNIGYTLRRFGMLAGYKLAFNKKASKGNFAYANIIESENDYVEGALYEFPDTDIIKLDRSEGFPNHYIKISVPIIDSSGNSVQAITYIAHPDKIVDGLLPQKQYLDHLRAGKDLLSKEYYNKLVDLKTCDEEKNGS